MRFRGEEEGACMVGPDDCGGVELGEMESAAEMERRGGDHGCGIDGLDCGWDVAIEFHVDVSSDEQLD